MIWYLRRFDELDEGGQIEKNYSHIAHYAFNLKLVSTSLVKIFLQDLASISYAKGKISQLKCKALFLFEKTYLFKIYFLSSKSTNSYIM